MRIPKNHSLFRAVEFDMPEKDLWAAIIVSAIYDLQKGYRQITAYDDDIEWKDIKSKHAIYALDAHDFFTSPLALFIFSEILDMEWTQIDVDRLVERIFSGEKIVKEREILDVEDRPSLKR